MRNNKRTGASDMERRSYVFEMRVEERADKKPVMMGHAAVFNEFTDLGWFKERVMPGAFSDSIGVDDVRALFNHDPNYVLGRNKSGTLRMTEDEKGLAIEIDPPDTQFARDLMVSMQRGDITQMSFSFQTIEDAWRYAEGEGERDERDLIKVRLFDVSPVTYPAYEGTDVAVARRDRARGDNAKAATPWRLHNRKKSLSLVEKGGS